MVVELRVRARVTVRTNLDQLIGGATEETIIARVGQGIITAIGSAPTHMSVMETPDRISKGVLSRGLDAHTAFEIVSIDIAEIDVGENIGARLQIDQAEADTRMARASAELRRAEAVAYEQEMKVDVAAKRALLVLAEAEIPAAIAIAFRKGYLEARRRPNPQRGRPGEPGAKASSFDPTAKPPRLPDGGAAPKTPGHKNERRREIIIMTTTALVAGTPLYVLMDGSRRSGPKIELSSKYDDSPIYGFSDKTHYDKFRSNDRLALTPYPLVRAFLRTAPDSTDAGLRIVVVDAIGPSESLLHAATAEAVLEALENRADHVTVTHHLIFDQDADAYRVEEVSV